MTERPLALAFPMPDGPELTAAYKDLYLAGHGDDATRQLIGDPALLPRPWTHPPAANHDYARNYGSGSTPWRPGSTPSTSGTPPPA